jgi:hypothetical protein
VWRTTISEIVLRMDFDPMGATRRAIRVEQRLIMLRLQTYPDRGRER